MQKLIYVNSRGQSITIGNAAPFILSNFDQGNPEATILTTKSPGQDGKSYHGTLLEERNPIIEGTILGSSIEDMFVKRKLLSSIFNPKDTGTLTYINDVKAYEIDCVVQSLTPKDKYEPAQEFQVQLFCPDPYYKEIVETKNELALWLGDFEFPLEIPADGIEMGHRVSNLIVNANNPGDIECGMRVEFKALASVVNPSILNVYTQEFIKVKRILAAGDTLVINTEFAHKSVKMFHNGVGTNVFNYIDLSTTFLQLSVGDNLLRYNAEQGIDNLECAIYFTPKYVGV
jgi:phage-related protein